MLKSDIFPECPDIQDHSIQEYPNPHSVIHSYCEYQKMYAKVSLRKVNVHFMKDNNSEVPRSARNKLPEKTNATAVI